MDPCLQSSESCSASGWCVLCWSQGDSTQTLCLCVPSSAGQEICTFLGPSGPSPSLMLILPLSLQGSQSKGAIRGCLCLPHTAPGSGAVVSWPLFSTLCVSSSTGRALASASIQGECDGFSLHQGPCLAPILGKWPQSFGGHSPAPLHCWLMSPPQPQQPRPPGLHVLASHVCPGQMCPRQGYSRQPQRLQDAICDEICSCNPQGSSPLHQGRTVSQERPWR